MIKHLVKESTSGDFSNLHAGTGTIYINFYDENGIAQEIVTESGRNIDYVIRGEPYQRPSKTLSVGTFEYKDAGGQVIKAYVYEKYT